MPIRVTLFCTWSGTTRRPFFFTLFPPADLYFVSKPISVCNKCLRKSVYQFPRYNRLFFHLGYDAQPSVLQVKVYYFPRNKNMYVKGKYQFLFVKNNGILRFLHWTFRCLLYVLLGQVNVYVWSVLKWMTDKTTCVFNFGRFSCQLCIEGKRLR